jgi:hypothetical protein
MLGRFHKLGNLAGPALLGASLHLHLVLHVARDPVDERLDCVHGGRGGRWCVGRDLAQPGFLPGKAALRLAAAVGRPVAAQIGQENRVAEPSASRVVDRVANLPIRRSTTNRRPQNAAISGMKGSSASLPRSSSVARISEGLLTSARSPLRSPSFDMSPYLVSGITQAHSILEAASAPRKRAHLQQPCYLC